MQKYNGYRDLRAISIPVLMTAALAAGCASSAKQEPTYAVEVTPQPASEITPTMRGDETVFDQQRPAPRVTSAAPVSVRNDAPLRYIVKKGDTLWDIANHFLLDAWQWPEIWYVNNQVQNPHRIYPGDVLSLVYVDGKPRLVGTELESSSDLERASPRIRGQNLDDAIPAIPIDAIRDFLASPQLVTPEQLQKAPYIVDFMDPQIMGGSGSKAYVKNLKAGETSAFNVVRLGQKITDPDRKGTVLGWEAVAVGDAEVVDFGKVSTVTLVRTSRESLAGDHLIEQESEVFDPFFYPKAPAKEVKGRIVSVYDAQSQIGQYAIVALNLGNNSGLARGDVLTVMQSGRVAQDPYKESFFGSGTVQLPDTPAGTLLVFKVTPKLSYALVMTATRPIHKLDRVVSPSSLR